MRIFFTTLIMAALAGCASKYEPPANAAATVPVTFINRGPGAVTYVRNSPEECSMTSGAGFIGVVGSLKMNLGNQTLEKGTRIAHSRPVTISMGWWDMAPVRECGEKITFTPLAETEYEIEFISTFTSTLGMPDVSACSLAVRERRQGTVGAFRPFTGELVRTQKDICIR